MSSANWPAPLQADPAALGRALSVVAEESFFAMVDPVPDEAILSDDRSNGLLMARVTFDGGFSGALCCTMPRALAHELTAAFTGATPDEIAVADPAVDDLAGEFANMVCGHWLTQVAPQLLFNLSHPSVEAVALPRTGHAPAGLLNGQPIWVDLSLEPPQRAGVRVGGPGKA
ncbi:MAG TPA: chemotaxis protein CheX [Vicinamibacterales bacterium]|nr:chemotaxis protein CheX [Vicinamibacterales bacterium]